MVVQYSLASLISLWIFLIYLGSGSLFFHIFKIPKFSKLTDLMLKSGIGFGITGNLIMILSFLHMISPRKIIVCLIVQTLIVSPHIISEIISLISQLQLVNTIRRRSLFLPFLPMAFILALYAARSLLPPTGFDALMYHLSTVNLYLKNGGFYDIFFNPQSDFPMLTEMNYMIGLAFNNDIVCRQIAFFTFLLSLGSVYLVCRFIGLKGNSIIMSILIYSTTTTVIAGVPECNVDFAFTSWTVFSLFMFYHGAISNSGNILFIASFFAAMAMQSKIFGVFIIPLAIIVIYFQKEKLTLRNLIFPSLLIFIMTMPWYIKSKCFTGSIIPVSISTLEEQGLGNPMGFLIDNPFLYQVVNVLVRIIAAPWSFSIAPGQHQGDTFGPILVAILPFLLFFKVSKNAKNVLLMAAVYFVQVLVMEMIFIKGGSSIRYNIFILITGIPVSMAILKQIKDFFPRTGKLINFFIITQIVLSTTLLIKRYHLDWKAIIFNVSRVKYLSLVLPEYSIINQINTNFTDGVVMTTYNYSNYYLENPYVTQYRNYRDEKEMMHDLRKMGVKYLFANDKLDVDANRVAFSLIKNKSLLRSINGFYLFRLD